VNIVQQLNGNVQIGFVDDTLKLLFYGILAFQFAVLDSILDHHV